MIKQINQILQNFAMIKEKNLKNILMINFNSIIA